VPRTRIAINGVANPDTEAFYLRVGFVAAEFVETARWTGATRMRLAVA
jgi:hypothetical protein